MPLLALADPNPSTIGALSMKRILSILALLAAPWSSYAGPFRAGANELDGEAITCDLPPSEHLKNSVGRDGLGLCVFTSIDHAAHWSNEPALIGFRDFMTKQPGGGWPEKVDEYIPRMAASKGIPTPAYVQHTGGDAEFLRLTLKTCRYVCVTYNGRDNTFYRGTIAHMVNLVHLSDKWAVIHDSNFPGQWLWMSPTDFLDRWRGSGGGWAIALLKAGPPPIPVNASFEFQDSSSELPKANCASSELGTRNAKLISETNFGITSDKVSSDCCYCLNGKKVNRSDAFAALDKLTDDSSKLRLTIVGDDAFRKKVKDDLAAHPALAEWRDKLLVQDYAPKHWAVDGVGFAPGITLQSPAVADGKAPVLFRMTAYTSPETLAGAIRKADPNYQPERDPDPSKPVANPQPAQPSPSSDSKKGETMIPHECLYGLIGAVIALIAGRLGIPLFASRSNTTLLSGTVRQMLLEILKGLNQAPTDPDAELRTQLTTMVEKKRG
jgi:hypothetical protein